MEKWTQLAIARRRIILFLMVIMLVFGIYSYYIIPKQENPDTTVSIAMITTIYPGASPMEVESMVTNRIEDAISDLDGVESISSYSMNSASVIIAIFDLSVKKSEMAVNLRSTVSDIQSQLPDMCQTSSVNTDLVKSPQFIVSLSGDAYSQEDLAQYGNGMKRTLEAIDGVVRVKVEGMQDRQVNVVIDIAKLDLYNLSVENVLQLLKASNLSIPSGAIDYESGEINVNTPATFSSLSDIENLVIGGSTETIGFVKLKDIADVSIDYSEGYKYQQDGHNAIMLTGYFEKDRNAVLIGKDVRDTLEVLKKQVPDDIVFHEVMFSPEDISRSINGFIVSLIESIILIIVVVMLGVKFKNGVIVSIALPLSIFATFIVMYLLKIEFQFISIAALIISLGILVDNAIVISEAIQHKLDEGMEKMKAIIAAVKETAAPVFTSTLTTIITFSILYFVPGAIGETVKTIPTVVITALVASYFVAMIIIPILAFLFFDTHTQTVKKKKMRIKKGLIKLLNASLKHKTRTLVAAFGTLIIAAFLVLQMGMSFFPYSDKPILYMNIQGETLNLEKTEDITKEIHAILDTYPAVEHYATSIGKGLPRFFLTVPSEPPADNFAQIMVQLDLDAEDDFGSNEDVGRALQKDINSKITGANVEVKYVEYSMPMDAKIVIKLMGDDLTELKHASLEAQRILGDIPGTTNIRHDYIAQNYEYVVKIDSELLSTIGLIKYDVVKQINTALMGAKTSTYIAGGSEMDIIVSGNIESLDDLYRLPINSSITNAQVLLEQVADISLQPSLPAINRYDKERCITVLSDIEPGHTSIAIESAFKKQFADYELPEDVHVEYVGEVKNMMDLLSNIGGTSGIAVVLIYIVLLFQFRNFKKPFIVLVSIPLSFIGCFLGLFILRMDFQAMAILGIVSLIGIVVNNGIILVEFMDAARKEGMSVEDACRQAVSQRYRPIILSALTTCMGLVPLILARDPMSSPMASVLFFGLLFSTVLTMVVVPVMYAIAERERKPKKKAESK